VLQLDPPDGYFCEVHSQELTEQVMAELRPVREVVGMVTGISLILRRRSRLRTFTVIVTCPGTGPETKHECQFSGHYTVLG
jgi:hypothetical protein